MRSVPLRECLCSEFSLAQQKRTKEGLGPVLAGQRGSAHRTDMKLSGFIRQCRGTRHVEGELDVVTVAATIQRRRLEKNCVRKKTRITEAPLSPQRRNQQFPHGFPERVSACTKMTKITLL